MKCPEIVKEAFGESWIKSQQTNYNLRNPFKYLKRTVPNIVGEMSPKNTAGIGFGKLFKNIGVKK